MMQSASVDPAVIRAAVDPELRAGLVDAGPLLILTADTLPELRRTFRNEEQPVASYARDDVQIAERFVPGPAGAPDVRVVVYRPRDARAPLPAYLSIHGGGYLVGRPEGGGARSVELTAQLGCLIVSVDYRLAPETPAPGPIEDCYAALLWLYDAAAELGVDRDRIAIGGESAGGGLAAALGLMARDRGRVKPCFQQLIYPMLDDRTVTREPGHPAIGAFVWTPEMNAFAWRSLLAQVPGAAGISPYAAAARAIDLRGLPPTYVEVGALDLFLAEDLAYAQRLLEAGVPTELHVVPAAYHAFEVFAPAARVSQWALRQRAAALARAFAPAPARG